MNSSFKLKASYVSCLIFRLVFFPYSATAQDIDLFVAKALSDPTVFVMNPPADRNPYQDLPAEQIQKLMYEHLRNGSFLVLFPNGKPNSYISRKDGKKNGPSKQWYYPSGQLQGDELWEFDRIISAKYFDSGGHLLSEIKDGNGIQISGDNWADEPKAAQIVTTTNYRNGLKDGVELRYIDYAAGIYDYETHFKEGNLHGKRISWSNKNGQRIKREEQNFTDGKADGEHTYWNEAGQVINRLVYKLGEIVSRETHDDSKFSTHNVETLSDGTIIEVNRFPDGKVSSQFKSLKSKILEAETFDIFGNSLGALVNGSGTIVSVSETLGGTQAGLLHYKDGTRDNPIWLPTMQGHLRKTYNPKGSASCELDVSLNFLETADINELKVRIFFPPKYEEEKSRSLVLALPKDRENDLEDQTKVVKDVPCIDDEKDVRNGIIGLVTVVINGNPVNYQLTINKADDLTREINWSKQAIERIKSPPVPEQGAIADPKSEPEVRSEYQESLTRVFHESFRKRKDGTLLPELKYPASYSTKVNDSSSRRYWLLLRDSPELLSRLTSDSGWTTVRADWKYRPEFLSVLTPEHLVVWGRQATTTPEKGIPFVIEESKDRGESWFRIPFPYVDYLLALQVAQGSVIASGVRLPKSGLQDGADWFELPKVSLMGSDFSHLTENNSGFNIMDPGTLRKSSLAPNGSAKVYIFGACFLDCSTTVFYSKSRSETPTLISDLNEVTDLVWSKNSKFVAFRTERHFTKLLFVETGKVEAPSRFSFTATEPDKVKFDARVQELLEANAE